MSSPLRKRDIRRQYVHQKLRRRLKIFLVMLAVMSGVSIYDIIIDKISIYLALLAVGMGLCVGYLVGSISKIRWHEEESIVIAKMDRTGIVILILYISFSISRRWIFDHWIHGATLSAFSFSFAAGAIFGRFMTTRIKISKILKERNF